MKYEFFLHSFHDHTNIVRHLERRAKAGWLLKSTGFLWRYEKAQPQNARYAVTYFADIDEEDKLSALLELCESAGWQHVADTGELLIFRAAVPNPLPLETDPEIQVDTIHRTMKFRHLKTLPMFALLVALSLGRILYSASTDPLSVLLYPGTLFGAIANALCLLSIGWEYRSYHRWHKAAQAAAQEGEFLATTGGRGPHAVMLCLIFLIMLTYIPLLGKGSFLPVVGTLSIILGGVALSEYLRKRGILKSRRSAMIFGGVFAGVMSLVLMVGMAAYIIGSPRENGEKYQIADGVYSYAYHDPLPLYMEDLYDVEAQHYSNRRQEQGSFFLHCLTGQARRRHDAPDMATPPLELGYRLYTSRFSAALDIAQAEELANYNLNNYLSRHYQPIPAANGALEAWQLHDEYGPRNEYLLRFETALLALEFPLAPTEEQFTAALNILVP